MAIYLGDLAPAAGLAPAVDDPDRALYLQWLVYGAATVYPAYIRYYHPNHHRVRDTDDEAVKTLAVAALNQAWRPVEAALQDGRPWLPGDRCTAPAIYVRSEARREGKEGVRSGRSWGSPYQN